MSFWKKTVRDIDLANKTVLLRADYNVPVDESGHITDDYRVKQSLETIKYLLERNCRVVICSHLGRPKDAHDKHLSLRTVAKHLGKLLDGTPVAFAEDCVGDAATKAAKSLKPGEILVLENLRFHPEEEQNDDAFAGQLASLAEVFVQDGFGVVHRAHASTDAVTRHLPSVAGLLLEKEVDTITDVIDSPKRPLMAIIGGAKIDDKIDILNRFIDIADFVAVGGAMANTFLLAEGIKIGENKAEPDEVPLAKEIIEKARSKAQQKRFVFYIPQDGVVADGPDGQSQTRIVDWDAHVIAAVENYPKRPPRESSVISKDEMRKSVV